MTDPEGTEPEALAALLTAFEELLDEENAALRTRDVASLELIVVAKDALLAQLATAGGAELTATDRARLLRIRERNEINGLVIRRSAAASSRLLGLLRGETPEGSLYTQGGGRTSGAAPSSRADIRA